MYYIINILTIIILGVIFTSIAKLAMSLFTKRKISYTTSYRIMWLCSFLTYATITVCVTLMSLHVAIWLGAIVGTLTFIGMFLDPNRPISKDVKHSLEIARSRRN